MTTNKQAKSYNSPLLSDILSNISSKELEIVEDKMKLAIKIADAIKAKGLTKSEFAQKLNKNNSEISKWLSGTHNFTTETLLILQKELDIKLIDSDKEEEIINIKLSNIHIEIEGNLKPQNNKFQSVVDLFSSNKQNHTKEYSFCI